MSPDATPGPTTGSPDPAGCSESPLLLLAVDHRNSLEHELYGLKGAVTAAQAARISADKVLVYQALLDSLTKLPAGVQPGILVDEEYGASVAELASSEASAVKLAMPIEASGHDWFEFAYGDDWVRHAEYFATDFAKILVRDNPGFDPAQRVQQAGRVAQISNWAKQRGTSFIIELLIPPSDADNAAVDGDRHRYDDELRPGLTLETMQYLQDQGIEPTLWKVEGLDAHADAVRVVAVAKRDGRTTSCIVLGRHAPHDQLDHWLEVAAPVPGFVGFAIGRSIWWDALHSHLRHHSTGAETRRRISENYVEFVRYYVDARDGALPGQLDPEQW